MFGNEKTDQDDRTDESKGSIAKTQGAFLQLKRVWNNRKTSPRAKIKTLNFSKMKRGFHPRFKNETWALRETEQELLDFNLRKSSIDCNGYPSD